MEERHYSGTYTRLVVDHVELRGGPDGVHQLLERAGQPNRLAVLTDASWSSYDQFRRLLETATDILGPDGLLGITDAVENYTSPGPPVLAPRSRRRVPAAGAAPATAAPQSL